MHSVCVVAVEIHDTVNQYKNISVHNNYDKFMSSAT
jgi:hypothetical protein